MNITESQQNLLTSLSKNISDIIATEERRKQFEESLKTGKYNRDILDINNKNPLESIVIPLLKGTDFPLSRDSELKTVDHVDLEKYCGKWYEIARLPNSFQKDVTNVSAEYTLKNGVIQVVNSARRRDGSIYTIIGYATPKDETNSKLNVTFFWPFVGNYYIVKLGAEYEYSVVTEPTMKNFWILSRTKTLSKHVLDEILQEFPSNDLIFSKHDE